MVSYVVFERVVFERVVFDRENEHSLISRTLTHIANTQLAFLNRYT